MSDLESYYGLNFSIKSFAVANESTTMLNKVCYQLGKNMQPFGLYIGEEQNRYGVTDLSVFGGFVDSSITLVKEIANYRRASYKSHGMAIADTPEMDKILFFDYLMSESICYVEIPKFRTKDGVQQRTFDKFLVTKNPAIMATWMGVTSNEMQLKYSSKIQSRQVEFMNSEIRAVKLTSSAKGTSIVCPRGTFSTTKMTCIPLFMTYAFMKGMEDSLRNSIVKFTYMKDNNTIRELPTTLSPTILMDYYQNQQFVEHMLQGVDIFTQNVGGMELSTKQARGYVKVPEIGSSKYDATGCRSLNLARILKCEIITEVDRTFIDVDLSSCLPNFNECIDYVVQKMPAELAGIWTMLTGEECDTTKTAMQISQDIKQYAETRHTILSTTFERALHMFMINNPNWFPLYTGKPNSTVTSSANFGVETMDF